MIISILGFLLLFSLALGQTPSQFLEEHVQLTYDTAGFLHVSGIYRIRNGEPANHKMLYPVPPIGPYDSTVALCLSANAPLDLRLDASGLRTHTYGAPLDTHLYLWGYRQKPQSDTLLYILRSTRAWSKPLLFSHIEFQAPLNIGFGPFSYSPDSIRTIGPHRHWYWTFRDFMPARDWMVVKKNRSTTPGPRP